MSYKQLCAIVVVAVLGTFLATATPINEQEHHLLGSKQCTWGPSFWCKNLTNAKSCNAVRHCIQTVWEKHSVPEDNDSICKICKDMVTQARDQLRSNETMEELKEVFEGSCNLIPIKIVRKECDKLADDFVPELVEALSSQMNPDQVCSVAGLCNNAKIDELLVELYRSALDGTLKEESATEKPKQEVVSITTSDPLANKKRVLVCSNCQGLGSHIVDKFNSANRDEVLEYVLHLCGEMSSFSDACANIVLTYFNEFYDEVKKSLRADGICHLSGVCSWKYHSHKEDKTNLQLEAEAVPFVDKDDIPCQLCEQLVQHLREVLIANTTEAEFKHMLEVMCKQTKSFKDECVSIVDQYYDVMYKTLVNDLDANGACFLIGVCPKGSKMNFDSEIRPMLPSFPPAKIKVTLRKKLGANEPKFTQEEIHSMALPIDRLMGAPNPDQLVNNGELCTMCEYLMHFIQETLATPSTEDEIKSAVNGVCDKLPASVKSHCHDFIDMYGDAVIALLIQGLNPRDVCPQMHMCPKNLEKHEDVEVFNPAPVDESDKPTCPLCLFAVEQAQEKIKNDKSKSNIKHVLEHLCNPLPGKLKPECEDFIETYTNELVDMLITDFKPEEICVALKLCPKTNNYLTEMGLSTEEESSSEEDEAANEIDDDSRELPLEIVFDHDDNAPAPNCWLCEEFIKNAEKRINKHTSKADIIKALQRSCEKLRRNMRPKCHRYVERYGDKIATLILTEMNPKIICRELGLCAWSELEDLEFDEALKYDVIALPNKDGAVVRKFDRLTGNDDIVVKEPPTCVLCEFVMAKLELELKNKTRQDEIKHTIENICHHMPKTVSKSCDKFVEQYASAIIAMIGSVPPKEICLKLQLCFAGLAVINDEVIECGVCHGAAMSLLPYFKEHLDQSAITGPDMTSVACESLPAKYYQICSEMVSIYGQSILHLSQKSDVNEAHICAEIGKCFDSEKSGLAFARIST